MQNPEPTAPPAPPELVDALAEATAPRTLLEPPEPPDVSEISEPVGAAEFVEINLDSHSTISIMSDESIVIDTNPPPYQVVLMTPDNSPPQLPETFITISAGGSSDTDIRHRHEFSIIEWVPATIHDIHHAWLEPGCHTPTAIGCIMIVSIAIVFLVLQLAVL